jgi:hypothetical protein
VVTDVAQLGGVAALQAEGATLLVLAAKRCSCSRRNAARARGETLLVLAAKRVALGTMVSRRAPVAHPRDF